jgi:hypothetical protein
MSSIVRTLLQTYKFDENGTRTKIAEVVEKEVREFIPSIKTVMRWVTYNTFQPDGTYRMAIHKQFTHTWPTGDVDTSECEEKVTVLQKKEAMSDKDKEAAEKAVTNKCVVIDELTTTSAKLTYLNTKAYNPI